MYVHQHDIGPGASIYTNLIRGINYISSANDDDVILSQAPDLRTKITMDPDKEPDILQQLISILIESFLVMVPSKSPGTSVK